MKKVKKMALSATDRARTAMGYQRENRCPGGITKPQLAAAIAAADDFVDSIAASYAAALPAAFRNNSNAAQKGELLGFVLARRIGKLAQQEDGS